MAVCQLRYDWRDAHRPRAPNRTTAAAGFPGCVLACSARRCVACSARRCVACSPTQTAATRLASAARRQRHMDRGDRCVRSTPRLVAGATQRLVHPPRLAHRRTRVRGGHRCLRRTVDRRATPARSSRTVGKRSARRHLDRPRRARRLRNTAAPEPLVHANAHQTGARADRRPQRPVGKTTDQATRQSTSRSLAFPVRPASARQAACLRRCLPARVVGSNSNRFHRHHTPPLSGRPSTALSIQVLAAATDLSADGFLSALPVPRGSARNGRICWRLLAPSREFRRDRCARNGSARIRRAASPCRWRRTSRSDPSRDGEASRRRTAHTPRHS